MKLPIICAECIRNKDSAAKPIASITFRDDGRYEVICPKGHSSVTILQQQKFEILFDIGICAIADGYYREAVSSCASSLECFYRFFISAALFNKGLDTALSDSWKLVASQSERQIGAFVFLYTSEIGSTPTLLSTKHATFRNDVIHKGKIPTIEEAMSYGQGALDVIRPILEITKKKYPDGVNKTILKQMEQSRGYQDNGIALATLCAPTIISLSNGDPARDQLTLEQALVEIKARYRMNTLT